MIDRLSDMCSTFSVATSLSFYENYENDTRVHQEKIHLLENGLKVLKMAF